jgi:phosphoketolase
VALHRVPDLVTRSVPADRRDLSQWTRTSPMAAVDAMFIATVEANPHLRPRVGNPDEMRSNRLLRTLDRLKFRVTAPEPGIPEDIQGAVITALNEEAVAAAALANKAGINLIHTYEAFGPKMQGAIRQEIIFADHCEEVGRRQGWLSIPLILTSHTWENAKNELSHQDPAMAESMLGELSHVSRALFPPDANTAAVVTRGVYQSHGQIWSLVVPKSDTAADLFTVDEAITLLDQGAIRLDWAGHDVAHQRLILTAIGSYQLEETIKASHRLAACDIPHAVISMLEPGKFHDPRSAREAAHQTPDELREQLYPREVASRIFVVHTRPEVILGVVQPLNTGYGQTKGLGLRGRGGTLLPAGILLVNRCTWAHILLEAAPLLGIAPTDLLTTEELAVLEGRAAPHGVITP